GSGCRTTDPAPRAFRDSRTGRARRILWSARGVRCGFRAHSALTGRGRIVTEIIEPTLIANEVSRVFRTGAGEVHACTDVSLAVHPGELLVIRGKSGSGKTTLLNLLGGLDKPTSGAVIVGGVDLATLSDR